MTAPFELSIKTDLRPAPGGTDYRRHYAEVLEEVKLADRLGYRSVWTTEQHGWDDGYLPAQLPALATFAAATERIRVGTGVLVLPYYNLRQVLESAVVVDVFSQGRLQLGVGAGVYPSEFELFGADKRRRGRTMEEGIPLLRRGLVDGALPDGPDGRLVALTPAPVQERLPIYVGGHAPAAVDRAVRLGDGFIGAASVRAERDAPRHYSETLRPALERHGRSLDDFHYVMGVSLWVSDDPERDWAEVVGPALKYQQGRYSEEMASEDRTQIGISADIAMEQMLVGTVDDVARRLIAVWREAPWHELTFHARPPGVPHERALEQIELVRSRLVPVLAGQAQTMV